MPRMNVDKENMRRGRGKGKKQNTTASGEDQGSGGEEKVPAYRRRGRPQKSLKDDIEEEVEKIEEENDDANGSVASKDLKNQAASENGRKRKRPAQSKENVDTVKEENGVGSRPSTNDSSKSSVGYRHNGSRRKNKPRRAAEAGVECNGA